MTQDLRKVDPAPFLEGLDLSGEHDPGTRPEVRWVKVADLRVDPTYQRDINRRGAANIRDIAKNFSWRKFGIVIVAPLEDGAYAIVDGQHRTFGAAGRGIGEVPCLVIEADARAQADAFVSINSGVTLMTPLQIHASRLAAGDADALALVEACKAGGATVCRYPVPGNRMDVGQTLAVSVLYKMLRTHGAQTLALALRCITRTGDGNPGMIRAALVKTLCGLLASRADLVRSERKLLAAMGQIHLESEFDAATVEARKRKTSLELVLAGRISSQLENAMMAKAA